ncbi:7-cyano-7-deazaguanine synthase QueC [bacterium]|nr:7-cyano-7-deazaguanine synthase QueC [bacterium]
MKRAVCLISGGMDSLVSATIAKREGYEIYCLTVDYKQKAKKEIESAKKVAKFLKAKEHLILNIDLSWTKSALTRREIKIPKKAKGIPPTYVPARNTILLSLAVAYAETIDAENIFIGINSIDYSGYPDCRDVFVKKFQELVDVSTKKTVEGKKIKIEAPLLYLSKAEIVKKGVELGVDFSITWSCYRNTKKPCGKCDSCRLREIAFKKAKIPDPLIE